MNLSTDDRETPDCLRLFLIFANDIKVLGASIRAQKRPPCSGKLLFRPLSHLQSEAESWSPVVGAIARPRLVPVNYSLESSDILLNILLKSY